MNFTFLCQRYYLCKLLAQAFDTNSIYVIIWPIYYIKNKGF